MIRKEQHKILRMKKEKKQIIQTKQKKSVLIDQLKENGGGYKYSCYPMTSLTFFIESQPWTQRQWQFCVACGKFDSYYNKEKKVCLYTYCDDLEHRILTDREYLKQNAINLWREYKKNNDILKSMGIRYVKKIVSQGKEIIDILLKSNFYISRNLSTVNLHRNNPIPQDRYDKFFHNGFIFHAYELNKRTDGISNEKKEQRKSRYYYMAHVLSIDNCYLLDLQKLCFEHECRQIYIYPWMKDKIFEFL